MYLGHPVSSKIFLSFISASSPLADENVHSLKFYLFHVEELLHRRNPIITVCHVLLSPGLHQELGLSVIQMLFFVGEKKMLPFPLLVHVVAAKINLIEDTFEEGNDDHFVDTEISQ